MSTTTTTVKDKMNWEGIWAEKLEPGQRWDANRTEVMLQEMIDDGYLTGKVPPRGAASTVLVPGCGRGYSLVSFAKAGYATTGLELSKTAAGVAEEYAGNQGVDLRETVEAEGEKGSVKVVVGDFFELPEKDFAQKFDIVFDSTFLCAIPPARRQDWAKQMAFVLKPGGLLVSNIYPSLSPGEKEIEVSDDPGEGPPYTLSPTLAKQLLEPQGFKVLKSTVAPTEKLSRNKTPTPERCNETWMVFQAP